MKELIDRFKAASWPRRIAAIVFGIVLVGGSTFAIRMWAMPFFLRAYSVLVQVTVGYAFLTLIASIFSPPTGKKMAQLGIAVFERLLIDPLLMLFRAGTKKKKDAN